MCELAGRDGACRNQALQLFSFGFAQGNGTLFFMIRKHTHLRLCHQITRHRALGLPLAAAPQQAITLVDGLGPLARWKLRKERPVLAG